MSGRSRRAFLAGTASGLAALAGCSELPVVGDSGSTADVEYDGEALRALVDSRGVDAPSTYPGPVPDQLAETHYERAATLLEGVPGEPSFPNEAVASRLADERANVAEALSAPPGGGVTLDSLSGWRYDRGKAAEVRGAYEAANGDASGSGLEARRSAVRSDLAAFHEDWTYRAESPVTSFAVHRRLESLTATCRRYLVADRVFPDDPRAAPFAAGGLAGDVERARATLMDAVRLRDAYVTEGMDGYWTTLGTVAAQLGGAVHPTRRSVEPYVGRDASVEAFQRDVHGTPAERLFVEARHVVLHGEERADTATERGDYASAVGAHARTLVGLVGMSSVVEAIRDGEYDLPDSADAVGDHREAAVAALEDALAVDPALLAAILAEPALRALDEGDRALAERPGYERTGSLPDRSDVVRAVGHYGLAEHAAAAAPAVVDRVASELRSA